MSTAPLLVQLELLLDADHQPRPELLATLAGLARNNRPLVLLTPRPDAWRPTRSGMDQALGRQGLVARAIRQAGGELDAVLYLDFGLFSRKRGRHRDLETLAERYECATEDLELIVEPGRLADAVTTAGGRVRLVDENHKATDRLAAAARTNES